MGWFGWKSSRRLLPANIVSSAELFGQHEWAFPNSPYDAMAIYSGVLEPLLPPAQSEPEAFIAALATHVSIRGGWAAYGAERLMMELVLNPHEYPGYAAVMDASLAFLRQHNVPPTRVRPYEWDHWTGSGGTTDTWVRRTPVPSRAEARITDLAPGECRRVVQMWDQPDSNLVLVMQEESSGQYVAWIDAKRSDEDPTRSRREWKRSSALFDLYLDIAYELQSVHWSDQELEPFFPIPRCSLPLT